MVVTERIASRLRRRLIEPTPRQDAPRSLDPHHRRAGAAVLDRVCAFKAGFRPVIDVPLAGDIIGRDAVVRQIDNSFLPAPLSQLMSVISKRLADSFDVVENSNLAAYKLNNPDRHCI